MSAPRLLIAGLGNIFLGDDGFGPAVIEKLRLLPAFAGVRLVDFGVRARELAQALQECDAAILVDATARGEPPGTLYILEPCLTPPADSQQDALGLLDGHSLTAEQVLRTLPSEAQPRILRILGCEPETLEPDAADMGLSPVVQAAVQAAVPMIERLMAELFAELALRAGAGAHA